MSNISDAKRALNYYIQKSMGSSRVELG